ncbi:MAG: SRPBCC family protein [Gordonia sp. (in: high G+C Gram-positive bacteria)]
MPEFAQSRSIVVDADASAIHGLIDDFRKWPQWSPWEGIDPNLKRTYSGADAGVGAQYAWQGDKQAGAGSMEITGSTPERIDVAVTFTAPFKATNKTVFTLVPQGAGTRVEWQMTGRRNLVFEVFGRLFLDRAMSKQFDQGLADLKKAAETQG